MKTCPKCFDPNLPTATACKRCGLPFDQTAVNFGRNCPAGRHVMDPTWTVCTFCKAEGLVTDDMGEAMEPLYAGSTATPPPPRVPPFERSVDRGAEYGDDGTRSEDWPRTEAPIGAGGGTASETPVAVSRHARTQFDGSIGMGARGVGASTSSDTVREAADSPSSGQEPRAGDQAGDQAINRKTIVDDSPAIALQGGAPMADSFKGGIASGSAAGRSGGAAKSQTGYGGPGALPVSAGDQRKIVGILITYTWKPEGQMFPVREGRNWIGRDPNQADIVIEQDETLSSVNSTISYRSKFVIGDKDSMCGTWLDGKAVEELSHPLPNYSKIRTGSTTWTFIAIEPTAGETAVG